MRDNFDSQLSDLLEETAQRIPPTATVLPALHRRLDETIVTQTVAPMRDFRRTALPVGVVALIVIMAVTLFVFHPFFGPATRTIGAPPIPTTTMTPVPILATAQGITIQVDAIDANPIRIAVRYHFVTQPGSGNVYAVQDDALYDSQNQLLATEAPVYGNPAEMTEIYVPLTPGVTSPTTLTFVINSIIAVSPQGKIPSGTSITGPWTFRATVTPPSSGSHHFTGNGVIGQGITITPIAAEWINGTSIDSLGLHLSLQIQGIPVTDNRTTFRMQYSYYDLNTSGGGPWQPPYGTTILTLPDGRIVTPPAFWGIGRDANTTSPGVIPTSGTVMIDIVFQGFAVTPGETVQLSIRNIVTRAQSGVTHSYDGSWVFSLHL
jgi:hypothetical protein